MEKHAGKPLSGNYTDYFNSYALVSPSYVATLWFAPDGYHGPGLPAQELEKTTPSGNPPYERVNASNYPKLYEAIQEECAFRNIPEPAFYMDHSGGTRLGRARQEYHSVLVQPEVYDVMTKRELRALVAHEIKHLYQPDDVTPEQAREFELDCDRAAVDSTDMATIHSYVRKAAAMQIQERVPTALLRGLALAFHKICPIAAENFPFRLDQWHPSPFKRLYEMHDWSKTPHEIPRRNEACSLD